MKLLILFPEAGFAGKIGGMENMLFRRENA